VHLWSAAGKLQASYINLNQFQEVASAYSAQFDNTGNMLACGLKNKINLFDVNLPGKESYEIDLKDQVRGMISVIRFSEQYGIMACGSFAGGCGLIDVKSKTMWTRLDGIHLRGITEMRFGGHFLVTGGRKDDILFQWDVRNLSEPVNKFTRECRDSQRMYFDIDPTKRYLGTGCQSGRLLLFDLHGGSSALAEMDVHNGSVVSSVCFSPQCSVHPDSVHLRLLSASGSRCPVAERSLQVLDVALRTCGVAECAP
jgi:telomerase Cajal body protein 1